MADDEYSFNLHSSGGTITDTFLPSRPSATLDCITISVWDYDNTNHGFPVLEFTGTGVNARTYKFFKKAYYFTV